MDDISAPARRPLAWQNDPAPHRQALCSEMAEGDGLDRFGRDELGAAPRSAIVADLG